ncbi:MAG TPA: hypothetical protein VIU11_27775 [Nakamurella sp.]
MSGQIRRAIDEHGLRASIAADVNAVSGGGGSLSSGQQVHLRQGRSARTEPGARLVLHTALELQRRGGGLGVATLCGGGGQGDALLVEVPRSS